MQLQTQVQLKDGQPKIHYGSSLFVLGSCFSEHIGEKLKYFQFHLSQNPFGILFHPFGLENFLKQVLQQKVYVRDDLFQHKGVWHSFEAHSKLSHEDPEVVLNSLNSAISEAYSFLKESSHVFITLGTAFIYKHIESDTYVANCHKVPQKNFQKELISAGRVQKSLMAMTEMLQHINPDIHLIFTVSPVRHQKEGLVENNRSKAHLISAIHNLRDYKSGCVSYFPSYEILLDELRDYRFFQSDMLHPSPTAIAYIWERCVQVWIAKDAEQTMAKVDQLQRNLQHKAFKPNSEAHQQFLEKIEEQKKELKLQFPHFQFPCNQTT